MARKQTMRAVLTAALSSMLFAAAAPPAPAQEPVSQLGLQELREEMAIAAILDRLATAAPQQNTIIRNVRVVDPVDRTVRDGQSIVTSGGAIFYVGDRAGEPAGGEGAAIIDGGGRYAAPGVTDMHVHTESASSWLLNLANGVTTVREMAGFPWMLAARDAVTNDRLLAPTMYVAGTIINYDGLGGYAVTPRDTLGARRIVRQQAACGYDFIKIHNILPRRLFDAIADESRRQGLDLVGHVPQQIPVRYVVEHGMRTMEHVKGFLNDATLQIGDTDYAAVTDAEVWNVPTLYAGRSYLPAD